MKLSAEKQLILGIVKAWESSYPKPRGTYTQEALDLLKQLDFTVTTAEDIASIIGNSSWTDIQCDECNCLVKAAVQLGHEPDYDSATAMICFDCLEKALALKKEI